jgi:hypothetical protein
MLLVAEGQQLVRVGSFVDQIRRSFSPHLDRPQNIDTATRALLDGLNLSVRNQHMDWGWHLHLQLHCDYRTSLLLD